MELMRIKNSKIHALGEDEGGEDEGGEDDGVDFELGFQFQFQFHGKDGQYDGQGRCLREKGKVLGIERKILCKKSYTLSTVGEGVYYQLKEFQNLFLKAVPLKIWKFFLIEGFMLSVFGIQSCQFC